MFPFPRCVQNLCFKGRVLQSRKYSSVLKPLHQWQLQSRNSYSGLKPVTFYWTSHNCKYHSDTNSFQKLYLRRKQKIFGLFVICLAASGVILLYSQKNGYTSENIGDGFYLKDLTEKLPIIFKNGVDFIVSPFKVFVTDADCSSANAPGCEIPGLPTYTADDISAHDSADKRIWVCYKSGVYDVTDFIGKHPGGNKILMAAGGALEPFWELFAIHKDPKVLAMLEDYRIGNLCVEDRGLCMENVSDPFANDPRRHPVLKPRSVKPFNAEPPPELLVEHFITPNELFFVRNHLPVPEVDPNTYELEICGINEEPIYLTLKDLKTKFAKHTITSAVHCAGNRRSELNKVQEVKGLNWGSAAISNAEWSGAKLVDVLKHVGVDIENPKIKHVQFEGLDTDPANIPYGASVPAEKALDPKCDVLLAYEMNGKVLPRDHGFPVRVIVPGIVGARNVKWLGKIVLSENESDSHWQKNDYKGFSPNTTWENVDFSTSPAIQDLPVNSAICKPADGTKVKIENGKFSAAGYAWSGGGRKIIRVDVSVDGGQTWHTAKLTQDSSPLYHCWAWTLWKVEIPLPDKMCKSGTDMEIVCKAVDSSYNVQPDTFAPIWNLRGVLGNAWHRVEVKVE